MLSRVGNGSKEEGLPRLGGDGGTQGSLARGTGMEPTEIQTSSKQYPRGGTEALYSRVPTPGEEQEKPRARHQQPLPLWNLLFARGVQR